MNSKREQAASELRTAFDKKEPSPFTERVIAQNWNRIECDLSLGINAGYWAKRSNPCFSIHLTPEDWLAYAKENEYDKYDSNLRARVIFKADPEPRITFVSKEITNSIPANVKGRFIWAGKIEDEKTYYLILGQYIQREK